MEALPREALLFIPRTCRWDAGTGVTVTFHPSHFSQKEIDMVSRKALCLMLFCAAVVLAIACGSSDNREPQDPGVPINSIAEQGSAACTAAWFRYPTTPADFAKLYKNRGFYTDGNHLGRDIAYPEGTGIHPIACGAIRVYRPATGYGRLVTVIEHTLPAPVSVENGVGKTVSVKTFLSIYGHLRTSLGPKPDGSVTDLDFRPGDGIGTDETLGYVDADATNGDGAEHLHLGIRLQSYAEAVATDPYPFRGYDDPVSSKRTWFADPDTFLKSLMKANMTVCWHPTGTILTRQTDGTHWRVGKESLSFIPPAVFLADHLAGRDIPVSDEEFHCLGGRTQDVVSELAGHKLIRFSGKPAVYEYAGTAPGSSRWTFLNEPSFFSWGWAFGQEEVQPASAEAAFFGQTKNAGYRRLREGSLVKGKGESEVSVVSDGRRLPIYDWATFLALGYKPEQIYEVDPGVIDETAGPRGPVITPDDIQVCHTPTSCVTDCGGPPPPSSHADAGNNAPADAGAPPDQPKPADAGSVNESQLLLTFQGPIAGAYTLAGWWPGHDWQTIAACPDTNTGDKEFVCDLGFLSGASSFEFQVNLPDGRYWGDQSCGTGGCNTPVGTLVITKGGAIVPYSFIPNPSGAPYYNGLLAPVP